MYTFCKYIHLSLGNYEYKHKQKYLEDIILSILN